MSDELEGWQWGDYGNGEFYRKVIGRDCFSIVPCELGFVLGFYGGVWFATRQTLAEAQRLAHATVRLWAGDTG